MGSVRRQATALLVLALVAYVVTRRLGEDGWLGYANAAAEAALIGGLADWFAVTALFRHPLGLPIPHTAILPTRKDALGDSLASFVETNFFDDRGVSERLAERELSVLLGEWLADPSNARRVGDQLAVAATNVSDFLDDDLVEEETGRMVLDRLRQVPAAPVLARVIRTGTADGRIDRLVERAVESAVTLLERYRPVFRQRLTDESPWWVPDFVDERVYRRIETGLRSFADELRDDPDHVFRRELLRSLTELADRLDAGGPDAARIESLLGDRRRESEAIDARRAEIAHQRRSLAPEVDELRGRLRAASAAPRTSLMMALKLGAWPDSPATISCTWVSTSSTRAGVTTSIAAASWRTAGDTSATNIRASATAAAPLSTAEPMAGARSASVRATTSASPATLFARSMSEATTALCSESVRANVPTSATMPSTAAGSIADRTAETFSIPGRKVSAKAGSSAANVRADAATCRASPMMPSISGSCVARPAASRSTLAAASLTRATSGPTLGASAASAPVKASTLFNRLFMAAVAKARMRSPASATRSLTEATSAGAPSDAALKLARSAAPSFTAVPICSWRVAMSCATCSTAVAAPLAAVMNELKDGIWSERSPVIRST